MDGAVRSRRKRGEFSYYPIPILTRATSAAVSISACALIPVSLTYKATAVLMSLLVAALSFFFFFMTCKNKIIPSLTAVAYLWALTLFGSPVIPSIVLSLFVCIGSCSFFTDLCDKFSVCCLCSVPLFGFALAALMTKDPVISLCALLPCPVFLVQGLMCRGEKSKKLTVCATAAVAILMATCLVGIYMLDRNIALAALPAKLESIHAWIASFFTAQYDGALSEALGTRATELGKSTADTLFNVFPALVLICATVLAYLTHTYHYTLRDSFEISDPENAEASMLVMSTASAVIFLAALVCSFTTDASGHATLFSTVAENIYLILLPGLALGGVRVVSGLIKRTRSRIPFVILFLAIFLFSLYFLLIIALALAGAASLIIKSARKWADGKETDK